MKDAETNIRESPAIDPLSAIEIPGAAPITPGRFAAEVLGVSLWDKQEEVLAALEDRRRVAVKAGNGLGKGFCAGVSVLWFLYSHDPALVLSTAPTFRQVRYVLWRQVRTLYRGSKTPLGGKIYDTRWELSEERYAMGLSADSADQFQGFHNPNMLVVVDEAAGVSDEIYEAIDSVMTSAETSRLLLIGNPTSITGAFRRAFHEERGLYHPITISALDSPNVRAGRIVVPGLATAEWVEERREVWGDDDPLFGSRVLGEFPQQGECTLFKLSAIERAAAIDSTPPVPDSGDVPVILAVDVARHGPDRSVILRRRGLRVEEILTFNGMDTMELVGRLSAAVREHRPQQVVVDEIGVGAGVVDRLRELGHPVQGINVALPARQKHLFANRRAEGYWRIRELLEDGELRLPPDNRLVGELAAMRFSYDNAGRVIMESKDAMRRRGMRSPDLADALMMAFVEPAAKAKLWT